MSSAAIFLFDPIHHPIYRRIVLKTRPSLDKAPRYML